LDAGSESSGGVAIEAGSPARDHHRVSLLEAGKTAPVFPSISGKGKKSPHQHSKLTAHTSRAEAASNSRHTGAMGSDRQFRINTNKHNLEQLLEDPAPKNKVKLNPLTTRKASH
jgi:hypothetical protein